MSKPLVSIIMAAYNCEKYISTAIDSILNQTYDSIELLIADDASTDSTKQIIDSYTDNRIKRFYNQRNLGVIETRNLLINKSTGYYVTFQDADDWSAKNRIAIQVALLSRSNDISLCSTGFCKVDEHGTLLYSVSPKLTNEEIVLDITYYSGPHICYASMMTKRKHLLFCGKYRSALNNNKVGFLGGEDVDLLYRLLENGKILNVSNILYFYRFNKKSLTTKSYENISVNKIFTGIIGHQVAYMLRQQRLTKGSDDIDNNDSIGFNNLIDKIIASNCPSKAYPIIAPRLADLQHYKEFLLLSKSYLKVRPLHLHTYFHISISSLRIMLGRARYIYLRNQFFRLKDLFKTN